MKEKKIMVVCGGVSTEREISLKSGKSIYEALSRKGYKNTVFFDLKKKNMGDIMAQSPDIVFLGLHGKGGEDGCIQGMLELAGIPYTGPGVACSAVCMNKILTKRVLTHAGLPTPKFFVEKKSAKLDKERLKKEIIEQFGFPVVLKSPCQGSSIGVVIVRNENDIDSGIDEVFKYGDYLLVEQFVDGVEVTLPILGNEEPEIFPLVEITSERDFYDYTAKYTSGLCHHIIPACVDGETEDRIIEIGKKAYEVLGCMGLSRVDFIVDKIYGPMIIEVNTLPGMTDMSLFPDAARYVGVTYDDLVEKILLYGFSAKRDLI